MTGQTIESAPDGAVALAEKLRICATPNCNEPALLPGGHCRAHQAAELVLAFHGPVRFLKWSESSSAEFKFTLELLDGRDALAHFENATRRRGKKAGQRYRASWQDAEGFAIEGPADLWLAGANWAHQNGATVAFTPFVGDIDWIRDQPTADSSEAVARFYLALVQVDDDERPLNQKQASLVEWAETLVGGPHSKAAGMICADPQFQRFVGIRQQRQNPVSAAEADAWIKARCGIPSKKLLDQDDPVTGKPFWERYERWVLRPFIAWSEGRTIAPRAGE